MAFISLLPRGGESDPGTEGSFGGVASGRALSPVLLHALQCTMEEGLLNKVIAGEYQAPSQPSTKRKKCGHCHKTDPDHTQMACSRRLSCKCLALDHAHHMGVLCGKPILAQDPGRKKSKGNALEQYVPLSARICIGCTKKAEQAIVDLGNLVVSLLGADDLMAAEAEPGAVHGLWVEYDGKGCGGGA